MLVLFILAAMQQVFAMPKKGQANVNKILNYALLPIQNTRV